MPLSRPVGRDSFERYLQLLGMATASILPARTNTWPPSSAAVRMSLPKQSLPATPSYDRLVGKLSGDARPVAERIRETAAPNAEPNVQPQPLVPRR